MMKTRLNNLRKKVNNSMFDVAAAPLLIMVLGLPVLLIVVVTALLIFALKKIGQISKARKEQQQKDQEE